ncbi:uncharacterized protein BXZ73DRAFT_106900 [Epithele typhae]|uniref:uncharacterized protein n=1 Tax=Epithele typhae TaxID=378194 RepID=UPI0020088E88|nr:uncharacterized protein BXZ73DRAFT_106900 [Epithele typhae]KAH9913560.1 hypothetical protein BXZ73DRAFT_106900 [Epithele typhae]
MNVLHVWLDGQGHGEQPVPRPKKICNGDPPVVVAAHSHRTKLLILIHRFNALRSNDVYAKEYGMCEFYEKPTPQASQFNNLNHAENEATVSNGPSHIAARTRR